MSLIIEADIKENKQSLILFCKKSEYSFCLENNEKHDDKTNSLNSLKEFKNVLLNKSIFPFFNVKKDSLIIFENFFIDDKLK